MVRPTAVEPRDGYRIWLRYSDGTAGEVDLSHLAGCGVFEAWNDRVCFEAVRITEYDAVAWSEDLELCPDALYMQLTGKPIAEVMAGSGLNMKRRNDYMVTDYAPPAHDPESGPPSLDTTAEPQDLDGEAHAQLEMLPSPDDVSTVISQLDLDDLRELAASIMNAAVDSAHRGHVDLDTIRFLNGWFASMEETVAAGDRLEEILFRKT